jgi:hypothetical protein
VLIVEVAVVWMITRAKLIPMWIFLRGGGVEWWGPIDASHGLNDGPNE